MVIPCHKLLPIWIYPSTWEFCEGSKTSSRFICYSFSLNLKLTKMSKTSKHHLTKSVERLYLVSCHKVLQKEDFELHLTEKWATNSVLHVVSCQFVGFLHFSWHCCLLLFKLFLWSWSSFLWVIETQCSHIFCNWYQEFIYLLI